MVRNNKAAKSAARQRAQDGGNYTTALRRTLQEHSDNIESLEPQLDAPALKVIDRSAREQILARADERLDKLVGMANVKTQIAQLRQRNRLDEELERRNLPRNVRSNHLVFEGPIGTGKVAIARIVADIYAATGVCRIPKVVAVGRADLVADHWGASGLKVRTVVESALGGVLFIDEAHTLMQTEGGQHDLLGQEAVEALLNEMTDHPDDLVVILSGGRRDARRSLGMNGDLLSRFTTRIDFETYTPEDLADIAEVLATADGLHLEPEAKAAIVDAVRRMARVTDENGTSMIDIAGNGRFARNVIVRAAGARWQQIGVGEIAALNDKELRTLNESDVSAAVSDIRAELVIGGVG